YVKPVIYDTSSGPFVAPQGQGGASDLSLVLNFGLGQMRPDPDATVQIGFYTGQSNGLAQFNTLTIPASVQNPLYETWLYNSNNGNPSFSPIQGASPTGSILQLNGMPYNNGINWYQITFSEGGVSRTYNFY